MLLNTSNALKEWAVIIKALEAGQTIILLRKGGIRELNNRFQIQHQHFWLYPTYEHQKPELLKPEYTTQVQPVASGWHPQEVIINSAAMITHSWQVSNLEIIANLEPYHLGNQAFIHQRFKWKSHQPLSILLLRVYLLSESVKIAYNSEYSGCSSWLDLKQPISTNLLVPVINNLNYQTQVNLITNILNHS